EEARGKVGGMWGNLRGRGCAHVPGLGNVGVSPPKRGPIVILLSNDIRHDLSSPLRSRCLYTWLDPPTLREEVRILHARAPTASRNLVSAVTRIINCIRRDMPAVRDKPRLRESNDLLEALVRDGVWALTTDVIDQYLCFLGKRHRELLNLRQGIARLEMAARRADDEIDEWVELAFANEAYVLEEAA